MSEHVLPVALQPIDRADLYGYLFAWVDLRNGPRGRNKIVWGWCEDPAVRSDVVTRPGERAQALMIGSRLFVPELTSPTIVELR